MCDRIRRQPLTVAVRTPRNGMTSAIVPHSGDWIGRRRYADTSSARLPTRAAELLSRRRGSCCACGYI